MSMSRSLVRSLVCAAVVTISAEGAYTGPAEIVLQSLTDPLNNRIMAVEVR